MGRGGQTSGYTALLRLAEFRSLFVAQMLSLAGDRIAAVALAVLVFRNTHSPALAAGTYAATYLPWLVASPLLAPLVDRYPRRTIMVTSDVARAFVVGAMVVPGVPVGGLFALLIVTVCITPAFSAARSAVLPAVVPAADYVAASALHRLSAQVIGVAGYAIGGALLAAIGSRASLAVDAVSFLVSAAIVIRRVGEHRTQPRPPERFWAELTGGARFVFADRRLTGLLVTAWVLAAVSAVPEGLAVVAAHEFHRGTVAVGALTAAWPLGAFVAVFLSGRYLPAARRLAVGRVAGIAGLLVLAVPLLVRSLPVVFACWCASGATGAYQLPANAEFVLSVPDELRGRGMGLAQSGLNLGQGLALLGAGLAAQLWSAVSVVAGAGIVAAVAAAGVALAARVGGAHDTRGAPGLAPSPRQDGKC